MYKPIIKKGNKYNKLIAIKFNHKDRWNYQHWLFKCDCGKEKILNVSEVKRGHTKSCGCLKSESIIKRNKENRTHGMHNTRTYKSWKSMKERCLNKNNISYKNYGGRDITVCEEWLKFENFYRDMGKRPCNKSLDRINNNGNYCQKNCRWATRKEQENNKRNNHFLVHDGKIQTVSQWAEELNINRNTFFWRVYNGWNIEKILKEYQQ